MKPTGQERGVCWGVNFDPVPGWMDPYPSPGLSAATWLGELGAPPSVSWLGFCTGKQDSWQSPNPSLLQVSRLGGRGLLFAWHRAPAEGALSLPPSACAEGNRPSLGRLCLSPSLPIDFSRRCRSKQRRRKVATRRKSDASRKKIN